MVPYRHCKFITIPPVTESRTAKCSPLYIFPFISLFFYLSLDFSHTHTHTHTHRHTHTHTNDGSTYSSTPQEPPIPNLESIQSFFPSNATERMGKYIRATHTHKHTHTH